jgi:hypothetical protein
MGSYCTVIAFTDVPESTDALPAPSIHWSPAPVTTNGVKIRISLEKDGLREDFVALSVELDAAFYYSLVPDEKQSEVLS